MEKITRQEAIELGLKRYFTGDPCSHGHIAERYVVKKICVECSRLHCLFRGKGVKYAERQEALIRERVASNCLAYSNRADAMANGASHYFTGKPCVNGHICKRRTKDGHCLKCHSNKSSRQYHSNPAKHIARQIETMKKNPEVYRAIRATRRARKKSAGGKFGGKDILEIGQRQNWKCKNCQCCIKENYEIDHIEPLSRGGSNYPCNLMLLCKKCNRSKSDKCPYEWAVENGRLFP